MYQSRLSICIGALWLASQLGGSLALAQDGKVVAGYFVSWGIYGRNYHVTNIPADKLTHIYYAFANPTNIAGSDTGQLNHFDVFADTQYAYPGDPVDAPYKGSFYQLFKLKQTYPHIKTLISVGGWTLSDYYSDICASTNARATFVDSCLTFITNYDFDGIDFVWEYPVVGGEPGSTHRPEDADNYVLMLDEMRQELDAQEILDGKVYLMTATLAADHTQLTNRYRLTEMDDYIDWFNVMTYDYTGPWSGSTMHNAPMRTNTASIMPAHSVDRTIQDMLTEGVAPSQIVAGMPFYGYGFTNVTVSSNGLFVAHGGNDSVGTWEAGVYDFGDLRDGGQGHAYIDQNGFERHWDNTSLVPFLYNSNDNRFITYDDEESIGIKCAYAGSNDLAGVMCWSLDSDADDAALLHVMHQQFYPTMVGVHSDGDSDGVELTWYGQAGQVYDVWYSTDMTTGSWSQVTTLIDSQSNAVSSITGAAAQVTVIDTNVLDQSSIYYMFRRSAVGP